MKVKSESEVAQSCLTLRVLNRVPCAIQSVLLSYLFYSQNQSIVYICQSQISQFIPPPYFFPFYGQLMFHCRAGPLSHQLMDTEAVCLPFPLLEIILL